MQVSHYSVLMALLFAFGAVNALFDTAMNAQAIVV
jgi:hypothetical protein